MKLNELRNEGRPYWVLEDRTGKQYPKRFYDELEALRARDHYHQKYPKAELRAVMKWIPA